MNQKTLIVLVGPTGVGKTELSIQLAERLACPIISSDSRQIYSELKIGTAPPDKSQLDRVKHYFIAAKSITDTYNAGLYERDVIALLDELFLKESVVMLVGGSMLYIDAVCKGLDDIPAVSDFVRAQVKELYQNEGLQAVQKKLLELDPVHYNSVDLNNKQRVTHALEVCLMTGKPYSELRSSKVKKRNFDIIKIAVNLPRELLYARINLRVDKMFEDGLLAEAQALYSYKEYNALNTVGYKELFDYMDGKCDLNFAIQMIKQNSRRYAKRQLTWFNADDEITWFEPNQAKEIIAFLQATLNT